MIRRTFREEKTPGIPKNPAAALANMTVIMNTTHRNFDMKVSRQCTRMSLSGNIKIMTIIHQDSTLELPHERQHHVLGMTAIAPRPQTFTTMMLQECVHVHTKQSNNFEIENLLTLLKVSLLNLCNMTPDSRITQISMQHGNRKETPLRKQIVGSLHDSLNRATYSRICSRPEYTLAAGSKEYMYGIPQRTNRNSGGHRNFQAQGNKCRMLRNT